jgi:hypothetical protein
MTARLTARQARFIHEYMIDYNGSAAARRAGYSARSSRVQASQLLRHPVVGPCVRDAISELLAEVKGSAAHTLRERARAAYFDPIALFGENGTLLRLREMDAQTRALLNVRVEERANGTVLRYAPASREAAFCALERAQKAARDDSLRVMPAYVEAPARAQPQAMVPRVPPVLDRWDPTRIQPFPWQAQPAAAAAAQPETPSPVPPFPEDRPPQAPPPMPEPPKPPEGDPGIVPVRRDPGTPPPDADPGRPLPEDDPSINPPRKEPGHAPPQHVRGRRRKARVATDRELEAQCAARCEAEVRRGVAALLARDPRLKNNGAQAQGTPPVRPQPEEYDFRKDPDWMWGGRRKPTPEPEPSPALLEHLQNVARAAQREELMGNTAQLPGVIRAGTELARREPGYNPPWARPGHGRPRYAVGAGECSLDGYGSGDDILE